MMTEKRFAELKQAVTDFPDIAPTTAEARELIDEIERLRAELQRLGIETTNARQGAAQ